MFKLRINELIMETTRRCNMRCEMCLRGAAESEDMLCGVINTTFSVIRPWYEQPLDWLRELRERRGEFSFITHMIAEIEGRPIGFCQYYGCYYSGEYEDWGMDIPAPGELFSIDYLIGEPEYLRRGYSKVMIVQMLDRLRALGAKIVIVLPDKENIASNRALMACGFGWDGERYLLRLERQVEVFE